jgi:hypothetical protein
MVGYLTEESKTSTTAIAAAPEGSLVLLVLESGIVKLIDPETTQIVQLINCPDGQWAGGWARNSEYFAVSGRDGIAVLERDGYQAAALEDLFVTAFELIGNYEMLVQASFQCFAPIGSMPSLKGVDGEVTDIWPESDYGSCEHISEKVAQRPVLSQNWFSCTVVSEWSSSLAVLISSSRSCLLNQSVLMYPSSSACLIRSSSVEG